MYRMRVDDHMKRFFCAVIIGMLFNGADIMGGKSYF